MLSGYWSITSSARPNPSGSGPVAGWFCLVRVLRLTAETSPGRTYVLNITVFIESITPEELPRGSRFDKLPAKGSAIQHGSTRCAECSMTVHPEQMVA